MDEKVQSNNEIQIDSDQLPAAMILADENGRVCKLNRYAEKLAGGRGLLGLPISELLDAGKTRSTIGGEVYHVSAAPFQKGVFTGTIYILTNLEHVLEEESAHKVRESSEMAAEIAHEIRNPLGSIELFASLLKKTARGEKDIHRINQIILSVKTINERISELLRMSKKRAVRKQAFSLNRLMADIFRMPGQTDTFLNLQFADQEMSVLGDEKMLRQMFLNLLIQSLQILPPTARLSVETGMSLRDGNPYAEVTFRYEGEGSLFMNFDLPLGLNLAIIHHITHVHQGIANIGSNAISILLPVIAQ
ncbi:MAG: Signal transduction histidine-protein kinase AtoS [Syntrophus sp. SKADARSKE-3]|nr:Signal transduction histidine-protein kinase AtoS [Syntrophus sp. SKADARSKE-3]